MNIPRSNVCEVMPCAACQSQGSQKNSSKLRTPHLRLYSSHDFCSKAGLLFKLGACSEYPQRHLQRYMPQHQQLSVSCLTCRLPQTNSRTQKQPAGLWLFSEAAAVVMVQGANEPKILSLPAKRDGLFAVTASLIARSDSNGEDLEGFAGAGELPCNPFSKHERPPACTNGCLSHMVPSQQARGNMKCRSESFLSDFLTRFACLNGIVGSRNGLIILTH